ncbi:hypothetical protein NT01EI_2783 [Edwardsiella ictaluri 93-146]|uniref:Uncharacterized protein n=1 Tax=Edwardsiella ictaluri (strain 93-146) TaxID=634503 RepID=C5BEF0_EDWI9|nr:hypothetical protein NT01EI_2783 [Edwardsiella ictaluri 93-146]
MPEEEKYGNYFIPDENITRKMTALGQPMLYWWAPGMDMKQFSSLILCVAPEDNGEEHQRGKAMTVSATPRLVSKKPDRRPCQVLSPSG